MKNLFFIPFLILAILISLFSQKTFAQETKNKTTKKIKVKIKTNKNGEEKNIEWDGKDNEEMPEDIKKQIKEIEGSSDVQSIDFDFRGIDDKNLTPPKFTFKHFDSDSTLKKLRNKIEKFKNQTDKLSFLSDSLKNHIEIKMFGDFKNLENFDNFNKFDNLDNLKEGTTEDTKEVDLGDGKKATITTKRTVTIKTDRKTKKSTTETEDESINVYPNPSDGNFKVEVEAKEKSNVKISVINPEGKVVFEQAVKGISGKYSQDVNLSDAKAGVYIVKIEKNRKVSTKKIVVE